MPPSETQITIRELKMDGPTAIRIAKCLREHEPEIWEALSEELKQSMRATQDPYRSDPATWPAWANWTAVDDNNAIYAYEKEPLCNGFCGWLPNPQDLFEIIGTATHNPDWRNSLRGREFNNVDKQINEMTQTIKQPENEEPKSQPGAVSGSALLRELAPAAS